MNFYHLNSGQNGRPGKGGSAGKGNRCGHNGTIVNGIQNTTKITSAQQYNTFNKYKEYVGDNMAYNIRRTTTKQFIRKYERSLTNIIILLIYILCLCIYLVFVTLEK